MPVNNVVQAQVVDLRADTPQPTDKFFVDTNVWFWTVYASSYGLNCRKLKVEGW